MKDYFAKLMIGFEHTDMGGGVEGNASAWASRFSSTSTTLNGARIILGAFPV